MQKDDLILVDKPKGISSFDVIRRLRVKLGVKKMGHSGTLDPLASGLLIVGVGTGTKKLTELIGLPKIYKVEVLLGKRTDSGDLEGKVIEKRKIGAVDNKKVKEVLKSMEGEPELAVPYYSAVKVRGQPLYKSARKGKAEVKLPVKKMKVEWIKLAGEKKTKEGYILKLAMKVGSGTYVRSLAEEIGKRLKIPAVVISLRRTAIGEYRVDQAMKM
jgi:tRNA pseudouridine55 synthase